MAVKFILYNTRVTNCLIEMLSEKNICPVQETAILHMIADDTKGEGCHLIISSLTGSERLVKLFHVFFYDLSLTQSLIICPNIEGLNK